MLNISTKTYVLLLFINQDTANNLFLFKKKLVQLGLCVQITNCILCKHLKFIPFESNKQTKAKTAQV